jgi:hypothetical protein
MVREPLPMVKNQTVLRTFPIKREGGISYAQRVSIIISTLKLSVEDIYTALATGAV